VSQPSTKGRQERRGPHTVSALPGRSAAARARSLQRTRAAATELAAHRRRLLATSIEGGAGEDLLSADAMLLRIEPTAHEAALLRVAQAALVFDRNGHRASKAPAGDSRPPEFGHNGTPATDGSPPRSETRTGRGAGESAAHRIAAREGEGSTPSSRPKSPRAPYKLTGPTRAAALKAPAPQSRPPLTELRLSADPFSDREGESNFHQTACLLPVGGEDVTQPQER